MKYLLVLVLFGLTACGGGGGEAPLNNTPIDDNDDGGNDLDPTCKNLQSVWQSTTDAERHDLRSVQMNAAVGEYEYTAYDGATCGYTTNPNYALTAYLQSSDVTGTTVPWDYRLSMRYDQPMGGQCATYAQGSQMANDQVAYLKLSCNSLQICEGSGTSGVFNCKTFE